MPAERPSAAAVAALEGRPEGDADLDDDAELDDEVELDDDGLEETLGAGSLVLPA